MARRIASLLLVIALAAPALGFAKRGFDLNSIQPLQHAGRTFCTAFSIAPRIWATAGHCAMYAAKDNLIVTIDGHLAWIVYVDLANDVAVFESAATARALPLGRKAVAVRDAIEIIGYPYGIARTVTQGFVAARLVPILHPSYEIYMASDILDITTAGGNSGSPVLNTSGEVVGVLWGGFTESPHSLSIPLESLRRALAAYWRPCC